MTTFNFTVDKEFAKTHNEFFRDAKRLQISAGILALIMFAIVAVMLTVADITLLTAGLGISFTIFGLLCLIMIPILPRQMGDPQQYYDLYDLAPAVIARVNARDLELLALVDASSNSDKSVPALAVRTVSSIPGVPREVGARVPSMAVTGVQTLRNRDVFQEISPMPVAWGTKDRTVLRDAEKAISSSQWKKLDGLMNRIDDVHATKRNLLVL